MLVGHMLSATQPGNANPASGTNNTAPSTSAAGASGASGISLGGTDFLTLMLAQLKNQDPTSPVDSNTFLTQLAQLSEVQGITQLDTSFSSLSNSLTSSQALQASSLLGHQALVGSSTVNLDASTTAVNGAVYVPQTSAQVSLNISNSAGVLVQTINLGAQSAGLSNFSWNGQMGNGSQAPPGQYTLSANVAGVGSGTAITTFVDGTVQSVTMGAGTSGLVLNVSGLGAVPFADVLQISN